MSRKKSSRGRSSSRSPSRSPSRERRKKKKVSSGKSKRKKSSSSSSRSKSRSSSKSSRSRSRSRSRGHRKQKSRERERNRKEKDKKSKTKKRARSSSSEKEEGQDSDDDSDDKSRRRDKRGLAEPSTSVMVRGIPPAVTEQALSEAVAEYFPCSVRLIRDRTTGVSRGFGFMEFTTVEQAQKFVSDKHQNFKLQDRVISVDFSHGQNRAASTLAASKNRRFDWICSGCEYVNFARRDKCFQCNKTRGPDCTAIPTETESGIIDPNSVTHPNPVLMVRGLDPNTTEDSIRYTFAPMVEHGVKEIRMIKDKTNKSRGFCFVEFESTEDATQALQQSVGTQIEGAFVQVSFSRDHQHLSDGFDFDTNLTGLVNAGTSDVKKIHRSKKGNKHKRPPNISESFVYDDGSSCWYDATSGFYFDPTSQLYYHGITGIYYRWDADTQQYLQVDSRGVPANLTPEHPTPTVASTPEQGTSSSSSSSSSSSIAISAPAKPPTPSKPIDKAALAAAVSKSVTLAFKQSIKEQKKKAKKQLNKKVQGGPTLGKDVDRWNERKKEVGAPPELPPPEPDKWCDFDRNQCILCKRQFKALDQLIKHKELSELHKKNLEIESYKQLHQDTKKTVENKLAQAKQEADTQKRKRMFEDMVKEAAVKKEAKDKAEKAIDETNVGNRMLKAMGWKEGVGLGKKGTGIVAPIKAEMVSERAGLGSGATPINPGDTYQEAARRKSQARYDRYNAAAPVTDAEPTPASDYLTMMQQYKSQSCQDDDFVRPLLK